MNQHQFESLHEETWQKFGHWIDSMQSASTRKKISAKEIQNIPPLFRKICHHLAMAKLRMYSPYLISRLNRLVLDGHSVLYRSRAGIVSKLSHFLLVGFPQAIRRDKMYVLLSSLIFYGIFVAVVVAIQVWPDFAVTVLGPKQIYAVENMYNPNSGHFGRSDNSSTQFQMFAHYIFNNISISFRIFAGGLLLGVGTLFYLVFNGLVIGAVVGHLAKIGFSVTIFPFIIGHGSFELTAFVLAAAAGFKLGYSYINPGRIARIDAIKKAGGECAVILWGVFLMLVIAAFIEAYWSSLSVISATVKYIVGAGLWFAVIAYFIWVGRRHEV
ncbi:FIG01248689: hypothetical protein [hydrothermal vent metagenome]|uniref:Stage II sporulation protein M n=1 Tax=hydrothermal vent metagenome TaxID=652676 RepID=A0A3B0Z0W6_9ZZZZ